MSNAFLENTMLGMTWEEIEAAAKAGAVVFLPVGVVEAHGLHLPLGTDILLSLDRFGFTKAVLFNAHGDGLQKKAMKKAITECNAKLNMKTFWPVYEDDIAYEGFTGKEDFLALIPPFAFETALMQEIMPELVRTDRLEGLEPTFLTGEQRRLWNEGEPENKNLIPMGYVGDPAGSKYVKTDMKTAYKEYADGLANFLGV